MSRRNQPDPRLGDMRRAGYCCRDEILPCLIASLAAAAGRPAHAIVGGGAPSADGVGRSVVTIVGSRGNFCTGAMIAPRLVLTAAHCVQPGATYKIVEYGADEQPQLQDVKSVAIHPGFNMQAMLAHRATADVALLQLEAPPKGKSAGRARHAATFRSSSAAASPSPASASPCAATARAAAPSASPAWSRPASRARCRSGWSIRVGQGTRDGLGACTGDSGGPVFEDKQGGPVIVGVVSWSTGPNGAAGCGGLTGVTPLTLYRDWILQTARQWGAGL